MRYWNDTALTNHGWRWRRPGWGAALRWLGYVLLAAAVVCPPAALTSVGSLLVLAAGGLLWLVAWYAAIGAGHRQPLVAALLAWAVVCSQLRCLEGGA